MNCHELRRQGQLVAGCDEVGRGCLAGPVVAAAVVLGKERPEIDLMDSKKLSRAMLREKAIWIRAHALDYQVGIVNQCQIDEMNILRASFRAMHIALSRLRAQPDLIIVDGNRFDPFLDTPYECIIKGDNKFESIAAASILAKVYRDQLMAKLHQWYPNFGWNQNVGYPTKMHKVQIMAQGATPFHRMTFKGVDRSNVFR